MWGLIGGSGFENFEGFEVIEELDSSTPFGECSSGFKRVRVGGRELLFISRHGESHELLPSEINYRANIYALKRYGATKILSVSAIGSLKKEFEPGDLVVPSQYIDRTKSLRAHSFCGDGVVGHVSLAKPICPSLRMELDLLSKNFDFRTHFDATYVCIEGPYFSTQSESRFFQKIGASIIGMTNFPEYALAREAGLHYLPCCFVTDYDCWDDEIPHVTLAEILVLMKKNNGKAFHLLEVLLERGPKLDGCQCTEGGLKHGLLTPIEKLSKTQREHLAIVIE